MNVTGDLPPSEPMSLWYVGQHESSHAKAATSGLLREAQDMGYDMLTAPITTSEFQTRVVAKLEDHLESLQKSALPDQLPKPLIAPLTPTDTDLSPDDSNSALVAFLSPWIDLGSSDPMVADVSRQVFNLEIAYAAFCGIQNVLLQGPLPESDETQYARAVREALGMSPYLQLNVLLPMTGELEQQNGDGTHLAELASEQHAVLPEEDVSEDVFGSWDTWNAIHSVCDYNSRLSIGK